MPKTHPLLKSVQITFRANSLTQRILRELAEYYQEYTLGTKEITQTGTILAAIWDAYCDHVHEGEIGRPSGKPKPRRPKKRDNGSA